MLDHADRARPLRQDVRDVLDRESAEDTEKNDLRLVRRERRNPFERRLGRERRHRFRLDVADPSLLDEAVGLDGDGRVPRSPALEIDEPAARDREAECPQPTQIPLETAEGGRNVEPGLRREILGFGRVEHSKVSKDAGVQVAEQLTERGSVTGSSVGERASEIRRGGHPIRSIGRSGGP